MTGNLRGRCLCGNVTFELEPPYRDVTICHCVQCAQWTGSQVAATAVSPDRFTVATGNDVLKWYRSSDHADRGFCSTCGSSLFWRPQNESHISIMAGTIDDPSNLQVGRHIFLKDQRTYAKTVDNAPRYQRLPTDAEELS